MITILLIIITLLPFFYILGYTYPFNNNFGKGKFDRSFYTTEFGTTTPGTTEP